MRRPILRSSIKPLRGADPTPVRVVVVTMDSHLSGAASRAQAALRHELPGLDLVMHAADEWGSDPAALAACHADIATGDIIIATMLFLEDHIQAVLPALAGAAGQLRRDAVLHVRRGGDAADPARPVQHGDRGARPVGHAEAAARRQAGRRLQRPCPGEDAAPIAAADALHPGDGAGCAGVFPDAAILAGWAPRKTLPIWFGLLVDRYADRPAERHLQGTLRPAGCACPIPGCGVSIIPSAQRPDCRSGRASAMPLRSA